MSHLKTILKIILLMYEADESCLLLLRLRKLDCSIVDSLFSHRAGRALEQWLLTYLSLQAAAPSRVAPWVSSRVECALWFCHCFLLDTSSSGQRFRKG